MKRFWIIFIPLCLICAILLPFFLIGTGILVPKTQPEPTKNAPSALLYYGRSLLTEPEKHVYDMVEKALCGPDPKTSVWLAGVTKEEAKKAVDLFFSDHPECFWVKNAYNYETVGDTVYGVSFTFTQSGEALKAARAELDAAVDEILAGLSSDDLYQKTLYLHDELAKRVTYEKNEHDQTAYGALVKKQAVCVGYASAYQLLLQRVGIASWRIFGTSIRPSNPEQLPESHAWNAVWIRPGVCVYTDVTWDDCYETEIPFHAYFNLPLDTMAKDHIHDQELYVLPKYSHTDYTWFYQNRISILTHTNNYSLSKLYSKVQNNKRTAVFYYNGKDDPEVWLNQNIHDLLNASGVEDPSPKSYTLTRVGREFHVEISGTFSYQIALTCQSYGSNIGTYYTRRVPLDQEISLYVELMPGYRVPEHYSVGGRNGISVRPQTENGRIVGFWIEGFPVTHTSISFPPVLEQ